MADYMSKEEFENEPVGKFMKAIDEAMDNTNDSNFQFNCPLCGDIGHGFCRKNWDGKWILASAQCPSCKMSIIV